MILRGTWEVGVWAAVAGWAAGGRAAVVAAGCSICGGCRFRRPGDRLACSKEGRLACRTHQL